MGIQGNSARDGRGKSRTQLGGYILRFWVQCILIIDTAALVARVCSPNLI